MLDIFSPMNTESIKVKYDIVPYTSGRTLELGCGPWKAYPHFIGIDLREDWPPHIPWLPDIVMDCNYLGMFQGLSVDSVFSSYLLQFMDDPLKALKEWWRVIAHNGYLVLYLPHSDYYPDPGIKYTKIDQDMIIELMKQVGGWDLLVNEERILDSEYSFLQVYRKYSDKTHRFTCNKPEPEKTCAIVRYGGAGDMIQASSILPELKSDGYHITLYTNGYGYEPIKHDPHIDEIIVQSKEQVPNHELGAFWAVIRKKYDKFINLSESVETTLLCDPHRPMHKWPTKARDMVLHDHNYLEITHAIAEVPFRIHAKFYATPNEVKWAKRQRTGFDRVILWVLSGSGVHKCWPYMDQIIARVLTTYTDSRIFFCGDELSQMLESGWEDEKRVIKTCGQWNIRQSMAFAEQCDLVIGPETGVMNAVSMLDMPKIIFLSHSSIKNLTRDWKNTTSLIPKDCACYPCHKMIHGWEHCERDHETGVSVCQSKIGVETVWEAIKTGLFVGRRRAA